MAHVDVAIIGGGPAGSTTGSFLRKYGNDPKIMVLERETFPRDHVGESGLPSLCRILDETGVWDKVEAAGFPIKVGATYKWGKNPELWNFDFVPMAAFDAELTRPGTYSGQRVRTAFQVDRAVYDEILLDHAAELGCEVRETTRVVKVHRAGDRVTGLELEGGEIVTADWYIDASGHAGILRRAMDVATTCPTSLQNIAIWSYWRNAAWAETLGIGGTRVQVISVHNGWIWFIPLGPDRTSVGLIVPVEHYKSQSKGPDELYHVALGEDERLAGFLEGATMEGQVQTTKDWSFLSERHAGENWFLVGEASGFADPILAAGMSISQASAREAAFTILEMESGGDAAWLREAYDTRQTTKIRNHIRFADYWYSANAQFTDLREHTAQIARDNGLDLSPEGAWAWLAQGGFIDEEATTGITGFPLQLIKEIGPFMGGLKPNATLYKTNVFALDVEGAIHSSRSSYARGRVLRVDAYERDGKVLPLRPPFDFWTRALQEGPLDGGEIHRRLEIDTADQRAASLRGDLMEALEAMIEDGWVRASLDRGRPRLTTQAYLSVVYPR